MMSFNFFLRCKLKCYAKYGFDPTSCCLLARTSWCLQGIFLEKFVIFLQILLQNGADPYIWNHYNELPIDNAKYRDFKDIVDLVQSFMNEGTDGKPGSSVSSKNLNSPIKPTDTLLTTAVIGAPQNVSKTEKRLLEEAFGESEGADDESDDGKNFVRKAAMSIAGIRTIPMTSSADFLFGETSHSSSSTSSTLSTSSSPSSTFSSPTTTMSPTKTFDLSTPLPPLPNTNQNSPEQSIGEEDKLFVAAEKGDIGTFREWHRQFRQQKKTNFSLTALKNSKGNSLLHIAATKNQKNIVMWLSAMIGTSVGIDIDVVNDDGNTALHSAAELGFEDMCGVCFHFIYFLLFF